MAAVPFQVNITVKYQDGTSEQISCTVSDVATEYWLGQDGLSVIPISGAHGNAIISDILIGPATGTDTVKATIDINGKRSPTVVLNSANAHDAVGRQFQSVPLKLPAGAQLKFTQSA